jgi:hypothetical protein
MAKSLSNSDVSISGVVKIFVVEEVVILIIVIFLFFIERFYTLGVPTVQSLSSQVGPFSLRVA